MRGLIKVAAAAAAALTAPGEAWAFGRNRIWLPEGVSTIAPAVDDLFYLILWITGVAFVLVQVTLVWFLIRYRRREGVPAGYTHGNNIAEIVWTVVPTILLVFLALRSQTVWSQMRGTPPPHDLEVEITAEQFAWNIRYAGPDGTLNTADDVTNINQLHLPAQKTVLIHLKSKDVIHSFFVPAFRFKQDAVPGVTGRLWINAVKPANLEIVCAELCGLGHYRMRGFLVVEPAAAFDAWMAAQITPPPEPTGQPS